MKRTLCEFIFWNVIPSIRREIAMSIVKDFGFSQKNAAMKLGITPAAVSMYLSEKRGNVKILNNTIIKEIRISAENIIKDESKSLVEETCRICKILRNKNLFPL